MAAFPTISMRFNKIYPFVFLLFFLISSSPAVAQTDREYLESLVASAVNEKLWEERYWHLLLHYESGLLFGYKSEVSDPMFYFAPDGRTNPQAELEATLRSFFMPSENIKAGEDHPQCSFPARYKWLANRLKMDQSMLPKPNCERFERWRASLDVNRVTLVFASFYMASPASMFGHTLLRLDRVSSAGLELDLVDYGVHYAANMDTDNQLLIAAKGLLGLFDGEFTMFPYYMKVQQYGNLEARDIWEYQLSLNQNQVDDLMLHLWEIGSMKFNYYYFRENCAFELLTLLEVGNPQLRLTNHFPVATVPSETIKVVTHEEGLVAKRVYRPSLTTTFLARREKLDSIQNRALNEVIAAKETAFSPSYAGLNERQKAEVLDAFLDYRQYQVMRNRKKENEAPLISESRKILLERSQLSTPAADATVPAHTEKGPEDGHGSNKASFAIGNNNGGLFEWFSYRPTYNDLLSPGAGYAENSQIIYFDLSARIYDQTGKVALDSFKLVDISNIAPHDSLFGGTSWTVGFGFRNMRDIGCEECQAFYLHFSDGYAIRAGSSSTLYAMIRLQGETAQKFEKGYRVGAGPDVGALIEESKSWKTHIYAKAIRYPDGNVSNEYEYGVKQRWAVSRNMEFVAGVSRIMDETEMMITAGAYF
jgi:hypothetical protein